MLPSNVTDLLEHSPAYCYTTANGTDLLDCCLNAGPKDSMVIPVPWDTFKHAHPNRTMGLQNGGNWVHMCALGNWSKVHDVNKCVHHADGVWCFNSTENAPEVPLRSSSTTQRAAKLAALLACGFVAASVLAL